jgi:hypothetical protein
VIPTHTSKGALLDARSRLVRRFFGFWPIVHQFSHPLRRRRYCKFPNSLATDVKTEHVLHPIILQVSLSPPLPANIAFSTNAFPPYFSTPVRSTDRQISRIPLRYAQNSKSSVLSTD